MSLLLIGLAGAVLVAEGAADPLERLGLRRGQLRLPALALLVLGVLFVSFAADSFLRLEGLRDQGTLARFDRAVSNARGPSLLMVSLTLALAPALAEEIFFRGLVQRGLVARLGPAFAIPLTALAFAAVHGDWTHAAAAFPLGLYLGVVAHLAGSIRASILCHAVNNLSAVWVGAFGWPQGRGLSLLGVTALLAGCAGLLWLASRPRFLSAPPSG